MDMPWVSRLADDIIDINCRDCVEFIKPLSTSKCWCGEIQDLVDRELCEVNQCCNNYEEAVANEWERIRRAIVEES